MEKLKRYAISTVLDTSHEEAIKIIKDALKEEGFGVASCDACHTRHLLSVQEARQAQTWQTCHMGFDHLHTLLP